MQNIAQGMEQWAKQAALAASSACYSISCSTFCVPTRDLWVQADKI